MRIIDQYFLAVDLEEGEVVEGEVEVEEEVIIKIVGLILDEEEIIEVEVEVI